MTPCTLVRPDIPYCVWPALSDWCAFSTLAPSSVLPAWTEYGSSASVWWAARSAAVTSLASKCPIAWYKAQLKYTRGLWLNDTIVAGACYKEGQKMKSGGFVAITTASSSSQIATLSRTAMTASGATASATSTGSTSIQSSSASRAAGQEAWGLAFASLVFASGARAIL